MHTANLMKIRLKYCVRSDFQVFGKDFQTTIRRKNPPSPYQMEVSNAGFAYTNQLCLAGEDSRPILSLSREVLT